MNWFRRTRLAAGQHPPASLCWRGQDLVDWVRCGDAWMEDGRFVPAGRSFPSGRLNAAVADPTGRWAVVHERTGTSGFVLRDGEILRELQRSDYQAAAFMFPVCLFYGPGKRLLLAHCPESYGRIEIDDVETGERLTHSPSRKEPDFFHSRLAASPSGKRLLSAGWVWHPWNAVTWFDVGPALANPALLDELESAPWSCHVSLAEESSAAWLDDDRVLLGSSSEPEDPAEAAETDREHPGPRLRPNGLAVYDIPRQAYVQSINLGYPPGTMMPVGVNHVVTFFQRPRLVSLVSCKVIHEWTEIDSGEEISSIIWRRPYPVLALDPARARFAVGAKDAIEVVEIDVSALRS